MRHSTNVTIFSALRETFVTVVQASLMQTIRLVKKIISMFLFYYSTQHNITLPINMFHEQLQVKLATARNKQTMTAKEKKRKKMNEMIGQFQLVVDE